MLEEIKSLYLGIPKTSVFQPFEVYGTPFGQKK